MISKEFDAITKADIEALVANGVAEGRTIEYKQQLPGGTDDDKKEFFADVSSFANAAGGDLIFGVADKRDGNGKSTGIPEKADGLAGVNLDEQIRRLDDMLRSGIDPRIPGCRIRHVGGLPSGPVVIIRVPKSWASPHMVTFKGASRFFSRTSAGKYPLDVREIRAAFTASGDLRAKLSALRMERLGKIIANEAPISLPATPKIVLHLLPLTILDPASQVDLTPLFNDPNLAAPINHYSYSNRINFDGFLSYNSNEKGGSIGYLQVFRSGVFEAVDADKLPQTDGRKQVNAESVEQPILNATFRYFKTAKQIGVPLPLIVMVSLFGLKGFDLTTNSPWHSVSSQIDRDTLLLPDVLLEDYSSPPDVVLKPIFDTFWQSAGIPACLHYNDQGRWDKGQSRFLQ